MEDRVIEQSCIVIRNLPQSYFNAQFCNHMIYSRKSQPQMLNVKFPGLCLLCARLLQRRGLTAGDSRPLIGLQLVMQRSDWLTAALQAPHCRQSGQ